MLLRGGFCFSFICFTFYIFVISSDDGRDCRPKHVVYVRNKLMLELLCCCISRISTEDVNSVNATG